MLPANPMLPIIDDQQVMATLKAHQVPGAALGLLKTVEGRSVALVRSYGSIETANYRAVNGDTLFRVGSISKSFTGLAIALLVAEGKLNLDVPLTTLLPELKRFKDNESQGLTLRDFLTHRTGLDLGALDVLLWPQPNRFMVHDVLNAVAQVRRVSPIRSNFSYSNAAYVVAGEAIFQATGIPAHQYIAEQIFKPLGMSRCTFGDYVASRIASPTASPTASNIAYPQNSQVGSIGDGNIATPHMLYKGKLEAIRADVGMVPVGVEATAGGARCSANAMLQWLRFIAKPITFNNPRLTTAVTLATTANILNHAGNTNTNVYTGESGHMEAYGLGFEINVRDGATSMTHFGGVAGMLSYFAVWPQTGDGLFVLINASAADARSGLIEVLLDALLHAARRNVPKRPLLASALPEAATPSAQLAPSVLMPSPRKALAGIYQSNWLGAVTVCPEQNKLVMRVVKSPLLVGDIVASTNPMLPSVLWRDHAVDSDSLITVETRNRRNEPNGRNGLNEPNGLNVEAFKLRPITNSDFDFSYINFKRKSACPRPDESLRR